MTQRFGQVARFAVSAGLLTVCAVSGCNSSDNETRSEGGPQSDGGSQQYEVKTYDAGPIPSSFRYDSLPDPWTANTPEACKAFQDVDAGGPLIPQAVRDCECDNCLDWMHQCDAVQGCREIRECAYVTQCGAKGNMPVYCYFVGTNGKGCTEVIDKWANIGASDYLALKLGDCATAAKCPQK